MVDQGADGAENIGRYRREDGGYTNIADVLKLLEGAFDQFDKLIADGITNDGDLAAHYPFSPERWRLYKNGTRQFPQYGSVTGFTDGVKSATVAPAAGDTWEVETAERWTYKVGYVIEPSFAFGLNQSLQGDDIVTIAYGDADLPNVTGADLTTGNADGWIMSMTAAMSDTQAKLGIYENGDEKTSEIVDLTKAITVWSRFKMAVNWYDVGSMLTEETYTTDGNQQNTKLAEIGVDDGRGAQIANQRVQYAVQADGSTTGLELEVGSAALSTLGSGVTPKVRDKPIVINETIAAADTWEPVHALRVDPAKDIIPCTLEDMEILRYGAAADVEVLAISVDPANTDASGWSYPETTHAANSCIQTTSSVTTIPDTGGTVGAPDTSTNPGGFSVGHAILTTDGGNNIGGSKGGVDAKRPIYDTDIIVFLVRSSSADEVLFRIVPEQNW